MIFSYSATHLLQLASSPTKSIIVSISYYNEREMLDNFIYLQAPLLYT